MISRFRSVLVACMFAAVAVVDARAERPIWFPAPSDPVPGTTELVYADLLRLIVPDLVEADQFQARSMIDLRHISQEMEGVGPPDLFEIDTVSVTPVQSGEGERLAVLVDIGTWSDSAEGFAVLAIYELAQEPVLVDAAKVSFDRATILFNPFRLAVGESDDLLITASAHHNSSQSYVATALILLRNDRLELVDAIFTLSDRYCAFRNLQRLEISTGDGGPMAPILATVHEEIEATGYDCNEEAVPEMQPRSTSVTYFWDVDLSRYVPDSDAFKVLARQNETRF
jgi:hypothetical protein